jgi:hypothetical protein
LKESTLAQILTHLDAPELDDIERLLVPFARETIWYEPARYSAAPVCSATASRARSSSRHRCASLANGLCRMGATVMDHHMTDPSS